MKQRLKKRRCVHCGELFIPSPYNAYHQRYCGKEECRKASNRAGSKNYRKMKKDDPEFKKEEKERVYRWRKKHPDHRKRANAKKMRKKSEFDAVLRDFAPVQIDTEMNVLRDYLYRQELCLKGFAIHLNGGSRDDIGSLLNHYYDIGKHFSDEAEKSLEKGDFAHVKQGNHLSGAVEASAGGIRLDRSPPGA
jgi:hypothetical protein